MRTSVALALTAVLALSACGDDSKKSDEPSPEEIAEAYAETDAQEIVEQSNEDLADVESLHIEGWLGTGNEKVEFDLGLDEDGACAGTVQLAGVPEFDILVVDDEGYFKAPDSFWLDANPEKGQAFIDLVDGRWVLIDGDFRQLTVACNFESVTTNDSDEVKDAKVEGVEERDGEYVVELSFATESGSDGVAYILTSEPHYPVEVTNEGQSEVTYSAFNEPIGAEAPSEDDFVDLATL